MDVLKGCDELRTCFERIEKLFCYDTMTLLDCVLTDDISDPEYSANTVYDRLKMISDYERLYNGKTLSVEAFLLEEGYSENEISELNERMKSETLRHDELRKKKTD